MLSITSRTLIGILFVSSIMYGTVDAKPKADPETRAEMLELRTQKAKLAAQERLLKLKTALELRDNQMAAWNDYEAYMLNEQSQRHSMMADMQQRRINKQAPPTSLELAQKNVDRLEQQLANAKQRLAVFTDLYNVLDANQQKVVDRLAHKKVKRKAKELRRKMKKQ